MRSKNARAELFTVGGLRIEFDDEGEKKDQKTCIFLALHFDLSFRSRKEFSHEQHCGREGENVILFEYFPSAIYSAMRTVSENVL